MIMIGAREKEALLRRAFDGGSRRDVGGRSEKEE